MKILQCFLELLKMSVMFFETPCIYVYRHSTINSYEEAYFTVNYSVYYTRINSG